MYSNLSRSPPLHSAAILMNSVANPRQVILCLLEVARIACLRYGFIEAPGLVKFEQEIDRELAAEKAALEHQRGQAFLVGAHDNNQGLPDLTNPTSDKIASHVIESQNDFSCQRFFNSTGRDLLGYSGTATDDLIMRCYMRKEEEVAKKKEAEKRLKKEQDDMKEKTTVSNTSTSNDDCPIIPISVGNVDVPREAAMMIEVDDSNSPDEAVKQIGITGENGCSTASAEVAPNPERDLSVSEQTNVKDDADKKGADKASQPKSLKSNNASPTKNTYSMYDNRVDSLDSGEGRTESSAASTSHSGTRSGSPSCSADVNRKHETSSSIPVAITRSDSSSPLTSSNHTSSMGTSELSSSRSSLLSVQDSNSTYTSSSAAKSTSRHIASSDLDGKVMRIAKSYYGKGVTKGVKRLSEGKYKIADRIVFVRLLKGHRVMVRIGGGWDTLENFLFRHKSDPSQMIDVENLLPIETKMSFDKSPSINNNLVN